MIFFLSMLFQFYQAQQNSYRFRISFYHAKECPMFFLYQNQKQQAIDILKEVVLFFQFQIL